MKINDLVVLKENNRWTGFSHFLEKGSIGRIEYMLMLNGPLAVQFIGKINHIILSKMEIQLFWRRIK